MAAPLWLAGGPQPWPPAHLTGYVSPSRLAACGGLVSLGISDTLASTVGKYYGRRKICGGWPKTVEGTAAGIVGGALFSFALQWLLQLREVDALPLEDCRILLASVGAGLLEATTAQMDNIFIPLHYFALMMI
ncbi:hypothetical protein CYMTET_35375 [Cymbomonas tetramitiformis]|nr:hypothetical protein CYMTET_35375 [Cymbomonas tetramitiformis]